MTKTEILEAIKEMSPEERLEIIESIARMMREDIEEKARLNAEMQHNLAAAAKVAAPHYMPGGLLHDLWSCESEDNY